VGRSTPGLLTVDPARELTRVDLPAPVEPTTATTRGGGGSVNRGMRNRLMVPMSGATDASTASTRSRAAARSPSWLLSRTCLRLTDPDGNQHPEVAGRRQPRAWCRYAAICPLVTKSSGATRQQPESLGHLLDPSRLRQRGLPGIGGPFGGQRDLCHTRSVRLCSWVST
jgi:hypothetical protein